MRGPVSPRPHARRVGAWLLATAVCACATGSPVIEQQVDHVEPGALRRLVVAPFVPGPTFRPDETPTAVSGSAAADLVARFVSEAFAEAGVDVVPSSDLALAFQSAGREVPLGDPSALAQFAARQFGASAVLTGTVGRYRERSGEAMGSQQPASVRFRLALYLAPSGERLWAARFDETQVAFSQDVFRARHYPGYGLRWLSVAELARWGAQQAVRSLPQGMW